MDACYFAKKTTPPLERVSEGAVLLGPGNFYMAHTMIVLRFIFLKQFLVSE
jgi:hypothetical protein